MDPVTIRQCHAAEIYNAPNAAALWAEYAAESATAEMGPHNPQIALYQTLEDTGVLTVFGAFRDEALVGVIVTLISMVPHFGRTIATTESFFVRKEDRKGGTGAALLAAAEAFARQRGVTAYYVTAPTGGRLERALPHLGYRASNTVFVKGLTCTN